MFFWLCAAGALAVTGCVTANGGGTASSGGDAGLRGVGGGQGQACNPAPGSGGAVIYAAGPPPEAQPCSTEGLVICSEFEPIQGGTWDGTPENWNGTPVRSTCKSGSWVNEQVADCPLGGSNCPTDGSMVGDCCGSVPKYCKSNGICDGVAWR